MAFTGLSYFLHLLIRYFDGTALPAARNLIARILRGGSDEKVLRVDTFRVVAGVPDMESIRNFPVLEFVGYPRGALRPPI